MSRVKGITLSENTRRMALCGGNWIIDDLLCLLGKYGNSFELFFPAIMAE